MNIRKNSLVFLSVILFSSIAFSANVYVSTKTTKLYQQANFSSGVDLTLLKSYELEVLEKQGNWLKVHYLGSEGWVSRYAVSKSKPIKNKISFFTRFKNLFKSNNGRRRVSVVSTSGGIRGLSEGEVESTGQINVQALERLEGIVIDDQALLAFIEEPQS